GVAVGTLYRDFSNRGDLLRAVLDETFEDMTARLRAATALDDPRAALRAFLHTAGAIHEQSKSLFMVMHDSRFTKLCADKGWNKRSEEDTSELQSPYDLVCRLLLEKKKQEVPPKAAPTSDL